MKHILLILTILLFSCDSKINNLYEGDFNDVVKIADSLDKNIWMILGGGKNCVPCNRVIADMRKNKLFQKYENDFIFYKCNTNDSCNIFLQHLFLMTAVPNSYIMNRNKEVVSYLQMHSEAKNIEVQLEAFLNNSPIFELFHSQFKSSGNELLKMQNLVLKARSPNLDEGIALKLVDSSIDIEPCFYNLFYKSKLLDKMGLKNEADSCANLSLSYVKGSYQMAVYNDFINAIKKNSKVYRSDNKEFSKIYFQNSNIDCGYLKNNQTTPIILKYKNIGTKPLVVVDVLLSCGCTTAEWNKKPLSPGDSSQIVIKYNAEVRGEFYRTANIVSNAKENVEKITFKGIIK